MNVSVGVLYGCQDLLRFIGHGKLALVDYRSSFQTTYQVASAREVLEVAQNCLWVRADAEGFLYVTDLGLRLTRTTDGGLALRDQIYGVINITQPNWAKKIPGGRAEAVRVFPAEVTQCFREAGLLDKWDDHLIEWWDGVGRIVRFKQSDDRLRVGREAERLSVDHELARTGRQPIWQSLESNFSGFDILSTVDLGSLEPLRIEVKGTYQPIEDAYFVISRKEWETAKVTEQYVFHLWLLRRKPVNPICVPYTKVADHIPHDQGTGSWDTARIPFRAFT